MSRRIVMTILLIASVLATAGCRFDGVNSLQLPGNVSGAENYRITVEMEDVQNLVGNSVVKSGDVTVGAVRSVRVENGIAQLIVDLDSAVRLPAGTTARLAQKSLLGAQYLQLDPPAAGADVGTLRDGDVIGIERTSRYPETEQVLASVSLLLNGGALDQIRTVTEEWGLALNGREDTAVATAERLHTLISALDDQRAEVQRAIDSVDRLADVLARNTDTVADGVDVLAPALGVVRGQQESLTGMLDAMNRFAGQGREVLDVSADSIAADLESLRPVLDQLAGAGSHLAGSLYLLASMPFPVSTFGNMVRGDYLNIYMTLDLSAETLANDVLDSFPGLAWTAPAPASAPVDPLTAPLTNLFNTLVPGSDFTAFGDSTTATSEGQP
ncbi:MCE family protein [Rhodococcus sp. NPDC060086]|uniref:MCE family protein n=1 Tax=Rhodococcus sp. NPDC060086 TaxID=3347055 RepID=UPI00365F2C2D